MAAHNAPVASFRAAGKKAMQWGPGVAAAEAASSGGGGRVRAKAAESIFKVGRT
jgi:hypothetical protein